MTDGPFKSPFDNPFGSPFGAVAEEAGFSPNDLAGLVIWLDAEAGITLESGSVLFWEDQGTESNDFIQGNEPNRPLLNATGLNGFPSVSFDGSNDFMRLDENSSLDLTTNFSMWFVINPVVDGSFHQLMWKGISGNTGYQLRINNGNNLQVKTADGSTTDTDGSSVDLTNGVDIILEVNYKIGGDIEFRTNGVLLGTVKSSTNASIATNSLDYGLAVENPDSPNDLFEGEIAQHLLYNNALSTDKRNLLGNYFAGRYNLTFTDIV